MGFIESIYSSVFIEPFPKEPPYRVLLLGDRAGYFENVKSVISYSQTKIELAVKNSLLTIGGEKGLKEGLYTSYIVYGFNQDRLLNALIKNQIDFYNVKKYSGKKMRICISKKQSQKFFAIGNKMCYNIKNRGLSGKFYPIYSFLLRFGAVLGVVFFITFTAIFNNLIFSVDYYGSGYKYKSQVESYISSLGIKRFSSFSSFSLNELEDQILASNKNLSFASCEKVGNRLKIYLVEAEEDKGVLTGKVKTMYSTCAGEVESIKVYRGTAVVSVGDYVEKGAPLVEGYATVKEQTIEVNVLATITLKVKKEFTYIFNSEGEENNALLLAINEMPSENIIETLVTCEKNGDSYLYKVTLTIRRVLTAG